MFKNFTIAQRIQVGLILGIAFLLVLGTNRLDKRHFSTVQTTVNSVYKDRVIVQNLIYKLNAIFHAKELRFILKKDFNTIPDENKKAEELFSDFAATKLTSKEKNVLDNLQDQFQNLKILETNLLQNAEALQGNHQTSAERMLSKINQNLNVLAKIQLEESRELTELSNKSLGMTILLSKLEVAFLILIGIAMLTLIFYPIKTEEVVQK
ncbi:MULTISPECIES: MCP four helix bundle domain-containing protein [unclassified Cellulophaga]|uniref:MCP four helix bundle domain-containing protein n=1 Tax=unclassified Cellulophaga TaxID=2634405 RepID=UPI001C4F8DF5|nr:MCP four helix bundle domain-containing protein [Cellulophaga sp. HaHa_2_1]QXP53823.1 MCP four helix bundle domain-containing protein [Cellulophaga sp. HaHa_2_1]